MTSALAPRASGGARRIAVIARARVWWIVWLVLAASLYVWTASSSGTPITFNGQPGYYAMLADGFENGNLYLPLKPAPELLSLPDPFDPVANAPYRLHDASLYKGRYYLFYGPVPALLAYLPWDLIPGVGPLPDNLAAAAFSFAGLIFSMLLLLFLVRRFLPETPGWMVGAGVVALTFCNLVPFILRRPLIYEVALAAGYCFAAAGVWLTLSGSLAETVSRRRIALGSLCLGLAIGCRPNLGLMGAALLLALVVLVRSGVSRPRALLVAFGPIVACGLLLIAYNAARFGSPTEFGVSYQLAGADMRTRDTLSLTYLVPGLFYYLVAPARHDLVFPFFHISPPPDYPGTLPVVYDALEPVGGLFANVPIALLGLLALALPLHKRLGMPPVLGRVLAGGVSVALLMVGFVAILFWGATERYEVDVAWWMVIVGLLFWFALTARAASHQRLRSAIQVAGVLVLGWSVLFAFAISLKGYYDNLRAGNPGAYRALAATAGPLQTAAAKVAGKPLMLEVTGVPLEGRGPGQRYLSSATFSIAQPGTVELVSGGRGDATLVATVASSAPGWKLRVVDADGRARQFAADGGTQRMPVGLEGGLDTLRLTPVPPGPGAPPAAVHVADLRVVRP